MHAHIWATCQICAKLLLPLPLVLPRQIMSWRLCVCLKMTKAANLSTHYLSPGSICWAAFLIMGERLENSPNS